jgi:hypothetical protein
MVYNQEHLPDMVTASDLKIAFLNGTQWQLMESTVDALTGTIRTEISHFSNWAIMAKLLPAPVQSSIVTGRIPPINTVTPPLASPAGSPSNAEIIGLKNNTLPSMAAPASAVPGAGFSFNWSIVVLIVGAVLIITAGTFLILKRRVSLKK